MIVPPSRGPQGGRSGRGYHERLAKPNAGEIMVGHPHQWVSFFPKQRVGKKPDHIRDQEELDEQQMELDLI